MNGFGADGIAVVIGATGGIGSALVHQLNQGGAFAKTVGLSRSSQPSIDLLNEASIAAAAQSVAAIGLPLRLVIVATGLLHSEAMTPEKKLAAA